MSLGAPVEAKSFLEVATALQQGQPDLSIGGKNWSAEDWNMAVGALASSRSLQKLKLVFPDSLQLQLPALERALRVILLNPSLTSLHIDATHYGNDLAEILSRIRSSTLMRLRLSKAGLNPVGAEHLSKLLRGSLLEALDVDDNVFLRDDGVVLLVSALGESQLTHLGLCGTELSTEGIRQLAESLAQCPTLTSLDIWSLQHPQREGWERLAHVFRQGCRLTHLAAAFHDDHASCSLVLRASHGLLSLDLTDSFGHNPQAALEAVVGALQDHPTLQELMIRHNRLQGLGPLPELLRSNQTLTLLDVSNNDLDDASLVDLAAALRENEGLQVLRLSSNAFLQSECPPLLEALRSNFTLRELTLDGNKFSAAFMAAVACWLSKSLGGVLILQLAAQKVGEEFFLEFHLMSGEKVEGGDGAQVLGPLVGTILVSEVKQQVEAFAAQPEKHIRVVLPTGRVLGDMEDHLSLQDALKET